MKRDIDWSEVITCVLTVAGYMIAFDYLVPPTQRIWWAVHRGGTRIAYVAGRIAMYAECRYWEGVHH